MTKNLRLSTKCRVAATRVRNAFSSRKPRLSIITDFGNGDEAVYSVKSAARHISPHADITDICHNVPLGNILIGGWRLKRSVTLPTESKGTAYVVVIDPGVGTERKNVIVKTKTGKFLVGPDNGVLSLAFSSEGIDRAVEIENRDLTLLHFAQSRTFHGKDVFAPAAAHLLNGVPLGEFGRELNPDELAKISISSESTDTARVGYITDIDGFGSIRTNVPNHVPQSVLGKRVAFRISGSREIEEKARVVQTFGESEKEESVFVLSSTGFLDLAVNLGSASRRFGINESLLEIDGSMKPNTKIALDLTALS